jgi:hypothetical protein
LVTLALLVAVRGGLGLSDEAAAGWLARADMFAGWRSGADRSQREDGDVEEETMEGGLAVRLLPLSVLWACLGSAVLETPKTIHSPAYQYSSVIERRVRFGVECTVSAGCDDSVRVQGNNKGQPIRGCSSRHFRASRDFLNLTSSSLANNLRFSVPLGIVFFVHFVHFVDLTFFDPEIPACFYFA